ncbi:hypothetical protein [Streptomyces sp. NPDC058486]|uniref:hypothetical protein n=1 Tax=unclassified Streptomyces TaxID=2593676 RepID=UPI0036603B15
MPYKKPIRTRALVVVAGAAAPAATMVTPAQAAVPPAGATFQISTGFDGKTLCISSTRTDLDYPVYPLTDCNKSDSAQQWRRTDNGRSIKNVGTGLCIAADSVIANNCERARPGELMWQQDGKGRMWTPTSDVFHQAYRIYWGNSTHVDGPRLTFPSGYNNDIPQGASVYVFNEI